MNISPDLKFFKLFSRHIKTTERVTTEKNVLGLKHPLCGRTMKGRATLYIKNPCEIPLSTRNVSSKPKSNDGLDARNQNIDQLHWGKTAAILKLI